MWRGNIYRMFTVIFVLIYNGCGATNVNFNEQIREYVNNDFNLTNVKTLQKASLGLRRYASFAPLQNAVQFKEVPDSVLSGSSHGRGLLHHDHNAGYGLFDYEDGHYGHGYEYQTHESGHYDPHDYHHYDFHDGHHHGHHLGYGHHKHYDHHALAAKAILWPIAGIALLGAAAALVTNPVLLQLGVASGRKRRQIEDFDLVNNSIRKWSPKSIENIGEGIRKLPSFVVNRRLVKDDVKVKKPEVSRDNLDLELRPNYKILTVLSRRYADEDERKLIPVPLKYKQP